VISFRCVSSIEFKESDKDPDSWKIKDLIQFRNVIEMQIEKIASQVINLVDYRLIPAANETESKVFWYKLKGDYLRYIAEYERNPRRQQVQNDTLKSYQIALDLGNDLVSTNPILLGLCLNFSVFYYEIMNERDKACAMAKKYFDAALPEIDKLEGDDYKDTTFILQLLRDMARPLMGCWTEVDVNVDN